MEFKFPDEPTYFRLTRGRMATLWSMSEPLDPDSESDSESDNDMLCVNCKWILGQARFSRDYLDLLVNYDTTAVIYKGSRSCPFCLAFYRVKCAMYAETSQGKLDIQEDFEINFRLAEISKFSVPQNLGLLRKSTMSVWVDGQAVEIRLDPSHTTEYGGSNTLGADLHSSTSSPSSLSSDSTFSTKTMQCINHWLLNCEKNHSCFTPTDYLPTRLLDVGEEAKGEDHIRLVLSTNITSPTRYATLSHCWGKNLPLRLLSSNIEDFQQSISTKTIPNTFQDAVKLTRALGLRYIWIDSLCIIQDSEDDWKQEAAQMHQVYASGWINLAASASENSSGGMFRSRPDWMTMPYTLKVPGCKDVVHLKGEIEDSTWSSVQESPLNQRGWVFQERVLSPRTLHFTSYEVFWECIDGQASETNPRFESWTTSDYDLSKQRILQNCFTSQGKKDMDMNNGWKQLVTWYSCLKLSFQTDRLVAFSALARRFQEVHHLEANSYVAGLWKRDEKNLQEDSFIELLLWRVGGDLKDTKVGSIPSWSWASVPGGSNLLWARMKTEEYHSRYLCVIDSVKRTENDDPYGPLQRISLQIQAPLMPIKWEALKGQSGGTFYVASFGETKTCYEMDLDTVQTDLPAEVYFTPLKVEFNLVGIKLQGMILRAQNESRSQFSRLGYLDIPLHYGHFDQRNPWHLFPCDKLELILRDPSKIVNNKVLINQQLDQLQKFWMSSSYYQTLHLV